MSAIAEALSRLRGADTLGRAGIGDADDAVSTDLAGAGLAFASTDGPLESRWHQALGELRDCVHSLAGSPPALTEGGVYHGAWIESTGTINVELASRFVPTVARHTLELFATHQRADGLIPYKVTGDGPAFWQIQVVTPLARTVWNHYLLTGRDQGFLRRMYGAVGAFDAWLARHRDTRGTGGVEAFGTFDTGQDLSPRFWHLPDRCHQHDAARFDPENPRLPLVAPDLTAYAACQRGYLAQIAAELGDDDASWRTKATASLAALDAQCLDESDGFYYDRDATGEPVRLQSDVLLRVLACEVGDGDFFASSLRRYLLHPRKFGAGFGFTSVAMDDPRFDHDYTRNSWGGPVNFLSLVRAPHAFEHHGHVSELGAASMPTLAALTAADRFPQCLDPWTGAAGFTSGYSPSILWFLDTVERYFGVLPRPDGELWFSGLVPTRLGLGTAARATAYARRVDGVLFELVGDDERVEVYRDGALHLAFPRGWRVRADAKGEPVAVVGLARTPVTGDLELAGQRVPLEVGGNEVIRLDRLRVVGRGGPGVVVVS